MINIMELRMVLLAKKLTDIFKYIASARALFILLPWFMIILIVGTIAQKEIGVFRAEKIFFSSFIIWFGYIPLPGLYSCIAILCIGLLKKIAQKKMWERKNIGSLITHIGVICLFAGSAVNSLTNEEGFIVLAPKESSNFISDYHEREFSIYKNNDMLFAINIKDIQDHQIISHPAVPFSIEVLNLFKNCNLSARKYVSKSYKQDAQLLMIENAPMKKNDEENQFCMEFEVSGASNNQDGIYLGFENTKKFPYITINNDEYIIKTHKLERKMPFTVNLESFEKITYPGSNIAKEYKSSFTISDSDGQKEAKVSMNQPYHYKNYSFYQSSFIATENGLLSVFAVVYSYGKELPYIASLVMCVGILLQFLIKVRKK